jgi:hypothetical protein
VAIWLPLCKGDKLTVEYIWKCEMKEEWKEFKKRGGFNGKKIYPFSATEILLINFKCYACYLTTLSNDMK